MTAGLGSTYRLELHGLGFARATELVPYLNDLGIKTLYLSPIFAAAPGSTHGYDVIDPCRIDPALGTEDELLALFDQLATHEMLALLDIVPNHMAAVPENAWWWDVLRHGRHSEHGRLFDVDWDKHHGIVLVPVLSRPLAEVLADDAFVVDADNNRLELDGTPFPLADGTSPGALPSVLAHQRYRPAYWRAAAALGNYRRFFDINSLVALRAEDPDVFGQTHGLVQALCRHPAVAGVRVDHVDGLTDPTRYLQTLRGCLDGHERTKTVIVEKILAHHESVDPRWPVDGTTGYDFADHALALFVERGGSARLRDAGNAIAQLPDPSFATLARAGKRDMLERSFSGELDRLARLSRVALDREIAGHDLAERDLRLAWAELTTRLDVYRTYIDEGGATVAGWAPLEAAASDVTGDPETRRACTILREALSAGADTGSAWLEIAQRWQQLSGAVMAKGVEDTATYRYPGLLARCDVGSDPDTAGDPVDEFHRFARRRQGGLNATSTHDSKRSEDARCRLAVLSEADAAWAGLVGCWHSRFAASGAHAPHPLEELALYQAFLALWPAGGDQLDTSTLTRIAAYARKAAREAKLRTSWSEPDAAYEEDLGEFVENLHRDAGFRDAMTAFWRDIGPAALTNTLALVVLKACAPGTPDFFQGTELCEPTLTDPDNRRPVDFSVRQRVLDTLPSPSTAAAGDLLGAWRDGRVKTYAIRALLQDRRRNPALYDEGGYEPLATSSQHAFAFRRRHSDGSELTCVVPRLTYRLCGPGRFPLGAPTWAEEHVVIGESASASARDLLTGRTVDTESDRIPLGRLFDEFPVAVLRNEA